MKKFLFTLLSFFFAFPIFAQNTILVIGDSLSAGYGLKQDQGWVTLLRQRLEQQQYNYKVVNASISGDTTSNGLARLPKALAQYKPQITIIELGGNDGLRGLPIATIKNNLQHMTELAITQGSKVIIVGVRLPPNYGPAYTEQFQQLFADIASDNNASLVPLILKNIDETPSLMQADLIHPTAKAQSIILDNIWPELEKLLLHPQ